MTNGKRRKQRELSSPMMKVIWREDRELRWTAPFVAFGLVALVAGLLIKVAW
jgi:hypothetical protein